MSNSPPPIENGSVEETSLLDKINTLLRESLGVAGFSNFEELKLSASSMFVGIIESLLMTQLEGVSRQPSTADAHIANLTIALDNLSSLLNGDFLTYIDPEAINAGDMHHISRLVDLLYELHVMISTASAQRDDHSNEMPGHHSEHNSPEPLGSSIEEKERQLAQRHEARRQRRAKGSPEPKTPSVAHGDSEIVPELPSPQVQLMGTVVEKLQEKDPALLRTILSEIKENYRIQQYNQDRFEGDSFIHETSGIEEALEEAQHNPSSLLHTTAVAINREMAQRETVHRRRHRQLIEQEKHRRRNLMHTERVHAIKHQRFVNDIRNLQRKQRVMRESREGERTKALFKTLLEQKRNDLVFQRKQQKLILEQTRTEVENVQERVKNFYNSQVELLKEQIKEEESDFQLRLKHEREIRREALRHVKEEQEQQFNQLKLQMEQSSAVRSAPEPDTIRSDVYELMHARRRAGARKSRQAMARIRRAKKQKQRKRAYQIMKVYGGV